MLDHCVVPRKMKLAVLLTAVLGLSACGSDSSSAPPPPVEDEFTVSIFEPVTISRTLAGSGVQQLALELDIASSYANLSIYVDDVLAVDNIDIPKAGTNQINAMLNLDSAGTKDITFVARGDDIRVRSVEFTELNELNVPTFKDIARDIGIAADGDENLPKYGGPSVADINNNGHYDVILNNHNWRPTNQLLMNQGDDTFAPYLTEHGESLSWGDMHGTAMADINRSGELDIIVTRGGGNGTNPSFPDFFLNEDGELSESYADLGITESARGRGARFIDMNQNGHLDLVFVNAQGINGGGGAQHLFYRNKGDGTFERISVPGIEAKDTERALVLDFNGDGIDDILFLSPLSLWQGNGNFTFTDVTTTALPESVRENWQIQAAADVDVTGNGLPDIYLAKGLPHFQLSDKSLDFNPLTKKVDLNDDGNQGVRSMQLNAEGDFTLRDLHLTYRQYDGGFPVVLGQNKTKHEVVKVNDYYTLLDDLVITQDAAMGWPADRSENGIYIGYIGNGQWNMEWVKNQDVFWQVAFSLDDISDVSTAWQPQNRNQQDVLLINNAGVFNDESVEWNIPKGGNHWGVTYGDFNNSGFNDLFVYRYGFLKERVTDYLLLNDGNGKFEVTTMHGAHDPNDEGHGDMGQAFALQRDGRVDLLNGSEEGLWYMYKNQTENVGNFSLVHVGYSPKDNMDPMSAMVEVQTPSKTLKRRVGSAGENFSQSLLNTVHFGLGSDSAIERVTVRWRNGEVVYFDDVATGQRISTDDAELPMPTAIVLQRDEKKLRPAQRYQLSPQFIPSNAQSAVSYSSSNEAVASVDSSGSVTAVAHGEAEITVSSTVAEGVSSSMAILVGDFDPIYVTDIEIVNPDVPVYVSQTTRLSVSLTSSDPAESPDDTGVTWNSSDNSIASVDQVGNVTGHAEGIATITASADGAEVVGSVQDAALFEVKNFYGSSVSFDNDANYLGPDHCTNQPLDVTVNYHAGSGNTVNANGIIFRLRHLDAGWGLVNDYIIDHSDSALTESGTASVAFDLTDPAVIPTSDLPAGHFHYLFVEYHNNIGEHVNYGIGWGPGDITIMDCE